MTCFHVSSEITFTLLYAHMVHKEHFQQQIHWVLGQNIPYQMKFIKEEKGLQLFSL